MYLFVNSFGILYTYVLQLSGRCGRGHIVVGFITTNVVSSNPPQARCTYISLFLNKPLQYDDTTMMSALY
jgi:hypothetical protein